MKIIVFAISLFLGINLFAQNADELLTDIELGFSKKTKIPSGLVNSVDLKDLNIPFSDIYLIWDTLRVNPYKPNSIAKSKTYSIDFTTGNPFKIPVKGNVKKEFGNHNKTFNYGIDIVCFANDTVFNPFDGVVRVCKASRSYGDVVVVRHNNGLETVYSNLAYSIVDTNEEIKAGDPLGVLKFPENSFFITSENKKKSDNNKPESFLHWEIRFLGQAFNPQTIINIKKGKLIVKSDFTITPKLFEY